MIWSNRREGDKIGGYIEVGSRLILNCRTRELWMTTAPNLEC